MRGMLDYFLLVKGVRNLKILRTPTFCLEPNKIVSKYKKMSSNKTSTILVVH